MKAFSFCFTHSQNNQNTNEIMRLRESVVCLSSASQSAILSISHFILTHFPMLAPPSISNTEDDGGESIISEKEKKSQFYNRFQQPWNNYLIHLTSNGYSACLEGIFYIIIPVKRMPNIGQYTKVFEIVNEKLDQSSNNNLHQRIKDIFNINFQSRKDKIIGIIQYRPTNTNIYEPRINPIGLLMGNLFNNQTWTVIKPGDGHIPTADQLSTLDYLILPGSSYSVLDIPAHLKGLASNIVAATKKNKKLKVLGICFGHQLLSKYFGSKLEKKGRIGGIQRVQFDSEKISIFPFFSYLQAVPTLFLSEHHEDFVMTVPQGFTLLAKSRSCAVESLISNDGRIFTVQFHSQYYTSYTKLFQKKLRQYYGMNNLDKFYVKEEKEAEEKSHKHSHIFLQVFRKFISS